MSQKKSYCRSCRANHYGRKGYGACSTCEAKAERRAKSDAQLACLVLELGLSPVRRGVPSNINDA